MPKRDQFNDLTGKRFGDWLVFAYAGRNQCKHILFHCRCVCGTERAVTGNSLAQGRSLGCGCIRRAQIRTRNAERRRLPKGEAEFNGLYSTYKHTAKARSLVFELSKEFVRQLFKSPCHYCGTEPFVTRHDFGAYNGIDRVDSRQGYISGNVVPCCKICNRAKSDMSVEDFNTWVHKLTNHYQSERQSMALAS